MTRPKSDPPPLSAADPWAALALLTRLPVPAGRIDPRRPVAASAWCWPLIGLGLGLAAGSIGLVALGLGLPAGLAAGLVLAALMLLTGALHEDGLADSFDGLWGGDDRTSRLEIMRDSRIGTYGLLALLIATLLRWAALSALIEAGGLLPALSAAAMLSRAGMALLMAALPPARTDGLSADAGRPAGPAPWLGIGLALGGAGLLVGSCALPAAFWAALALLPLALAARARIGGQSGDILGAGQQLTEIAALAALTACIL